MALLQKLTLQMQIRIHCLYGCIREVTLAGCVRVVVLKPDLESAIIGQGCGKPWNLMPPVSATRLCFVTTL